MAEDDYRLLPELRGRVRHVRVQAMPEVQRPEPVVEVRVPGVRRVSIDAMPLGRRRFGR